MQFEHHIHAVFTPRNFTRVARREHADAIAVDNEPFRAVGRHFAVKATVHGVVAQQMRIDFIGTELLYVCETRRVR